MANHNDLGKKGEALAVAYLQDKGYQILERNYRYQKAEVDIIVKDESTLIAVEVKTRSTDYFGNPQEFINKKKIQRMTLAVDSYIRFKNFDLEVRFDVIAILDNGYNDIKIEHIEDAFLHF